MLGKIGKNYVINIMIIRKKRKKDLDSGKNLSKIWKRIMNNTNTSPKNKIVSWMRPLKNLMKDKEE